MIFTQSTKREKLTKSLKLELKPVAATQEAIERGELNKLDEELRNEMNEYKPYIDRAIVSILNNTLSKVTVDFSHLIELENEAKNKNLAFETKKEYRKKIEDEKAAIKKEIVKAVEENLPKPLKGISDITSAKFLKEYMPLAIEELDISEEEKSRARVLSKRLETFTIAMGKFLSTRATALETWAPSRVLENLDIYVSNIEKLKGFVDSEDSKEFVAENPEILSMISAEYYNQVLSPEAIDGYNRIISGIYDENGVQKKGYNQYINELNQSNSAKHDYTGIYYKKAKQLYKQILVPQEKQFSIEKIKTDDDLRQMLANLQEHIPAESIQMLLQFLCKSKPEEIMITGKNLHTFSHLSCGSHEAIPGKLLAVKEYELTEKKQGLTKKNDIKKVDALLSNLSESIKEEAYSVADIELLMEDKELYKRYLSRVHEQLRAAIENGARLESGHIFDKRKLFGSDESKKLIKDYLDSLIALRQSIAVLSCDEYPEDSVNFYNELEEKLCVFDTLTKTYNLTRNYLTSSPKDLAEENPVYFGLSVKASLSWWKSSDEKIIGKKAAIMKKDDKYYFLQTNPLSRPTEIKQVEKSNVSLMSYTTTQNPMMIFPKRAFTPGVKEAFKNPDVKEVPYEYENELKVTRELFEIKEKNLFTVGAVREGLISEEGMRDALAKLIDFYKDACLTDPMFKKFSFKFKETKEYADIGLFFDDAKVCTTKAEWIPVDEKSLTDAIEQGALLCFLITNLHMYEDGLSKTTYAKTFLYMMSEENMRELNFRLNSAPMVTYRKASMPVKITHKEGSILLDKRNINGEFLRADVYEELYNYVNGRREESSLSARALEQKDLIKTKVCKYDIQKYKRYQEDKYFISMSYTINYKLPSRTKNTINEEVAELVNNKYKTLVVVRGITDLLYICLYDENKKLLRKESLNVLNGIDYAEKLRSLSFERKNEKSENWNYDLSVKNIRNSYLNFAIAKILDIAIDNNAVIVVERVNEQFKDKMQAIDNQVYKTFESKLESRLLDYRKNVEEGEGATISNPLQLAQNYTFAGTPLQNGILFRMEASYTSNMCPETGFVNLFDITSIKTVAKKREFLGRFKEIKLVGDRIYYSFDYHDFPLKGSINVDALEKTDWTIIVGKPKTIYEKEKGNYEYVKYPVREVYEELGGDQVFSIDDIADAKVKILYSLLEDSIKRTTVKKCKEVEKDYFSSPVTEEDRMVSIAELKATNLANKFWCYMSKQKGEFSLENWLNSKQV